MRSLACELGARRASAGSPRAPLQLLKPLQQVGRMPRDRWSCLDYRRCQLDGSSLHGQVGLHVELQRLDVGMAENVRWCPYHGATFDRRVRRKSTNVGDRTLAVFTTGRALDTAEHDRTLPTRGLAQPRPPDRCGASSSAPASETSVAVTTPPQETASETSATATPSAAGSVESVAEDVGAGAHESSAASASEPRSTILEVVGFVAPCMISLPPRQSTRYTTGSSRCFGC